MIEMHNLTKAYRTADVETTALNNINLEISEGEFIAIMGPSGCGKSTLMNILGCLDKPTEGSYYLGGEDTSEMDDDELSTIRGARLGFIFQSYNLIQQLNVLENIEMPLFYQGYSEQDSHEIAMGLVERVGLEDRIDHKPFELSGGQQQRVAIARALAVDPLIILADEPTGNLDDKTAQMILQLLDKLVRANGGTMIVATHSARVASFCDRIMNLNEAELHDGKLVAHNQEQRENQ